MTEPAIHNFLAAIAEAGIVGAGGAGFPTHIKFSQSAEILLLNGAECEPLLHTDQYIMQTYAEDIVAGMLATPISQKVIVLKSKYQLAITALEAAIAKAQAKIELCLLPSFYPAGDEHVLVYEATGRVIPQAGLPLDVGVMVSNVGTMAQIGQALKGQPVTQKIVSVLGLVANPTLVQVPIGASVADCLAAAGGPLPKAQKIVIGGPMMGSLIDLATATATPVTKTTGAIIAIDGQSPLAQKAALTMPQIVNRAKAACIQCQYCTELCPRFLLGHGLHPHQMMRKLALAYYNSFQVDASYAEALLCSECGVCEHYACPMELSPRQVNAWLKGQLRAAGIQPIKAACEPQRARPYRKIPTSRLIARLGLNQFAGSHLADLKKVEVNQVTILLKQHIGSPATPNVGVGSQVTAGQMIAQVEAGQMGANLHASISGTVQKIDTCITITK